MELLVDLVVWLAVIYGALYPVRRWRGGRRARQGSGGGS